LCGTNKRVKIAKNSKIWAILPGAVTYQIQGGKVIKELFIDAETSGLDPNKHGLIEIAGSIRYKNIDEEFEFKCDLFKEDEFSEDATRCNGYTDAMLRKLSDPYETYLQFIKLLGKHVDRFDKKDKFYLIGYGVEYDHKFLRKWFEKNEEPSYFGSYFWMPPIDVMVLVGQYLKEQELREDLQNFKLATVAKYFHVGLKGWEEYHSALVNAKIARKIYDIITRK